MTTTEHLPSGLSARARLREQQQREKDQLAAVLAAESKLDAQRERHRRAVERADADLAACQCQ